MHRCGSERGYWSKERVLRAANLAQARRRSKPNTKKRTKKEEVKTRNRMTKAATRMLLQKASPALQALQAIL